MKSQSLETINNDGGSYLYVQVESVVEISTPEEMGEAQADVEGTVFVTQTEQPEDVQEVLVPPERNTPWLNTPILLIRHRTQTGPYTTVRQSKHKHTHLKTLSLPEVRWQLTKPKDVPLKRKETPTAPLFPEATQTLNFKPPGYKKNTRLVNTRWCFWLPAMMS